MSKKRKRVHTKISSPRKKRKLTNKPDIIILDEETEPTKERTRNTQKRNTRISRKASKGGKGRKASKGSKGRKVRKGRKGRKARKWKITKGSNVPGYKETDNFDIATKQGRLVRWLRDKGYDVEGRFEHYLKKTQHYIKRAIQFGYTKGSPHVFINNPRGKYKKCAIYLFENSSKNREIGGNLLEFDIKVFHFTKRNKLEHIQRILQSKYLDIK